MASWPGPNHRKDDNVSCKLCAIPTSFDPSIVASELSLRKMLQVGDPLTVLYDKTVVAVEVIEVRNRNHVDMHFITETCCKQRLTLSTFAGDNWSCSQLLSSNILGSHFPISTASHSEWGSRWQSKFIARLKALGKFKNLWRPVCMSLVAVPSPSEQKTRKELKQGDAVVYIDISLDNRPVRARVVKRDGNQLRLHFIRWANKLGSVRERR